MVKINNMRLNDLIYNIEECLEDIKFYTENKENFYKQLEFMKSLSSTNISYCDVFDF